MKNIFLPFLFFCITLSVNANEIILNDTVYNDKTLLVEESDFCDNYAFDAMEIAADEGYSDQEITDIGNGAYLVCWLMETNLNRWR